MFDELPKLNITACSDDELIAWIRQAFPILLETYRRFCTLKAMSCSSCPRKAKCDKHNNNKEDVTYLVLEPKIPKKYEGTGYREKNAGFLTINNNSAYKPSVTTLLREAIGNFVLGQNHPGHLPRIFKVSQYLSTLKMSTNPMHDEKLFNEIEKREPKCSETF